jgi:hypothetical protein
MAVGPPTGVGKVSGCGTGNILENGKARHLSLIDAVSGHDGRDDAERKVS